MKRLRPIIAIATISTMLGTGLVYLDHTQESATRQGHLVGAMSPTDQASQNVYPTSIGPIGWQSTGGGVEDRAGIVVLEKEPDRQRLDFKLPGFYRAQTVIDERDCSRITVPGLVPVQVAGLPELPMIAATLMVPEGGTTRVKIVEHREREIKMDPVEPSVGHLTRDVNPATVKPEFSDFYESDGQWPKQVAIVSNPFSIREYSGVNVRINPLRWDAGKGVLMATEHIVIDVITEGGQEKLPSISDTDPANPGSFIGVQERIFSNFEPPVISDKYQRLPTQGRMLMVAYDPFVNSLQAFAGWKRQLGIDVTISTVSELGGTSAGIAAGITAMYEEDASLTWVILVGDKAQVPTMAGFYDGSDSDSRYAMVDGSDIYPDLFVSRISATNTTQLMTQLNKFIAYEKNPATGTGSGWYTKAAGIASDEGSPSDFKRADFLREDLLDFGFDPVEQIYQNLGGSSGQIRTVLEKGCSIVNYLGHGSGYGWTSVYFSDSDVRQLDNHGKWPWVIDVSCSNGDFAINECFAEAWLRAGTPEEPRGAIAMIASTSLAPWVPPTVMQAEAIDLLVANDANTIGSLYYSGLMKVLDYYGPSDVSMQVMEQNTIFGDCSLMVRTREPETFTVPELPEIYSTTSSWTLDCTGPEGSLVTLTSGDTIFGSARLDESGQAVITLLEPVEDRAPVNVTISGYNMVPYIGILTVSGNNGDEVSPEPEPTPEPVLPATVALRGNYPNPFNPSTNIAFELPRDMRVKLAVYDIRGHLVDTLLDDTATAGRNEVLWNGRDSSGRTVSSGVYLYQLVTADGVFSGRMLLTK